MTLRRLTYFLLTGLCLMLSSCSDDDEQRIDSGQMFVQVHIGVSANPALMRGTPSGGDDGDGREVGINNENKVYSVTLLLFDKNIAEAANKDAVVKKVLYFSGDELKENTDGTYELKEPYRLTTDFMTYYVVAVVNDTYDYTGKTFTEIANMKVVKPWSDRTATEADHFVMTSTSVATLNVVNDGTKGTYGNPFTTDVTVERLAARIDIDNEGHNSDGDFIYDYKNTLNVKVGTVKIIDIQAFNLLNDGTYLLKHFSSDGTAAGLNYFGSEGTAPTQSQYVLDPHTLDKTTSGGTPTYYDKPFDGIADLATGITWGTPTLTADKTVASGIDAGHEYMILTYLQENTLPKMTELESATILPRYGTVLAIHYQTIEGGTPTDRYDHYYLKHNAGATTPTVEDPMAFSIVRNNIYRVTLIPPVKGGSSSSLTIKVKVWDKFTHSWIYM